MNSPLWVKNCLWKAAAAAMLQFIVALRSAAGAAAQYIFF